MPIIRDFNLMLNAGKTASLVINVNQYDSGETWRFSLYTDEGQAYTPSDVAIVGTKSDGTMIANAGTVSNGKAIITETQQMTAAAGKAVFELIVDSETHGTANFIVLVEESPTENGIPSESDLSLFEQAIGGISSAYIAEAVAEWMDEHLTPTTPVVDDSLSVTGAAADAKKTGDEITELKSDLNDSNIAVFNGGVIFDYNVAPGYFNTSGTFVSQTASKEVYTKFPVSAEEQYRFAIKYTTATNVVWLQMAYYDANDTFINRVTLTSTAVGEYECTLPIPEYVKYIAVMWREFDGADVLFTKVINDTDAFNKIKGTSRNLFDADWYNARFNSSSGKFELQSNNTDAATPPIIPVTGGNTYTITVGDFAATGGSWYIDEFANNSASRIKYTQVSDSIKSKTLTLDDNTAYLGIHHYISGNSNWRNLIPNYVQVEEGLSATQYVKHNIVSNNAIDALNLFTGNSDLLVSIVNQSVVDTVYKTTPSLTVQSVAHRGDDIVAPQCTAPAYIAARKEGFTVAENDIWLSADNEFVMWHDNTLGKLGNMVDINGYLMYTDGTDFYYVQNGTVYEWSGTSYASSSKSLSSLTRCVGSNYSVTGITLADLKRIDFGVYKDAKYAGTQILTFTEWVLLCKQLGMKIYVDHKLTWTSDLLTAAANIVKKLGMGARSSWLSVGRTLIPQLRSIIPNARYGILANPTAQLVSDYSQYLSSGDIFFDGDATTLTQDAVELGLMAGFGVEAYYVDFGSTSETDVLNNIRAYVSYGLTGITLDHYKVEDAFQYLIS